MNAYCLQVQSPLPVLQWLQRQALDLQKQVPFGAAAFSAAVGAGAGGGGVAQPVASRTAASIIRMFVIVLLRTMAIPLELYPMVPEVAGFRSRLAEHRPSSGAPQGGSGRHPPLKEVQKGDQAQRHAALAEYDRKSRI